MELLALLSNRDDLIIPDVKESIKKYTVYPLKTVEELEDLNSNIPLSLVIIDTVSHSLSSIEGILNRLDDDMVVLIAPEKLDKHALDALPSSVYDSVGLESLKVELPIVVERALERQRFKSELRLLKQSKENNAHNNIPAYVKSDIDVFSGRFESFPSGKYLPERVLVNFAKMLTASFDMRKLFNHFMDSVMEIARVSKMSVMLREEEGFYVKTHYGLDPYIAENLRLKKDSALVVWLTKHGRITQKPANPSDSMAMNIKKEMDLLQCLFSFPMTYKGRLIGVFNINNKITDEPFYREELEIIYVLCNYLAAAVKDIDLYHQMWYQKEFTKNILSSMNSGMIAIDRDEKITVFNQQAAEILNLEPSQMIGNDLRRLPSPLGDILYETMVTGTSYRRYEVEILPLRIPMGINSYRLLDEQQNPVGAGIVFSSLSDSKKLEEQFRRAEKLEAVNQLMAKIAHEIRNPLTSIQTYTQLINEKYKDDAELYDFYTTSVSNSIQKLDTLIDRLITFSISQEYNFENLDVNTLIGEISDYLAKNIQQGYNFIKHDIEPSLLISADKKLLVKAIYYVVTYIISRFGVDVPVVVNTRAIMKGLPSLEISIEFEGDGFTEEDKKDLFKPLTDVDNLETGLNIPISHKIVHGHNGSFDIYSEGDKNIFIISIPAIDRRSTSSESDTG
jgi:nitrogen-specific signal transduction histidine kinase